jgi:hypothetical protein
MLSMQSLQGRDVVRYVHRTFLKSLAGDDRQGRLVRGCEDDRRRHPRLEGLQPSTCAHAPPVAGLEPREAVLRVGGGQVIANGLLVLQEFSRDDGADGVRPEVLGTCRRESIAVETSEGFKAADLEGIAEHTALPDWLGLGLGIRVGLVNRHHDPNDRRASLAGEPGARSPRRTEMRRMSAALLGAVLVCGGISVIEAGAAHAAPSVVQQAQTLHSDVVNLLSGYVRTYSPDLSAKDRAKVNALVAKADLALSRLDAAIKAIPQAKSASAHRAAVAAALARQTEAKAAATNGMSEVTPLLTAHMNVFELLGAKRDADRLMGQLDDLGSAIRAA